MLCNQAAWRSVARLSNEPGTMATMLRFPSLVFACSFLVLFLAARVGGFLRRRQPMDAEEREDFGVVQGATLTLLGLIIGFTFSMAINRYDQRKIYEEEEANAIGTEYLRVDLLPADVAAGVREMLRQYVDHRVAFYTTRDRNHVEIINRDTAQLQSRLWSAIKPVTSTQPPPVTALVLAGMNDMINAQGYTQAAWSNRIPLAAWSLMVILAVFGCLLVGRGAHRTHSLLSLVLPLALSVAFFLIADLDSPRGGLIRVRPENLISLAESLKTH